MITKDAILTQLYTNADVNAAVQKLSPPNLNEDFKQHVFEILCKQPEEKIIELFNKSQLLFFTIRIMLTTARGKRHDFHKCYRQQHSELPQNITDSKDDVYDADAEMERLILAAKVIEAKDTLYFYDKAILEMYLKEGSITAISKKTGISRTSIHSTIKKAKQEIRDKCNKR